MKDTAVSPPPVRPDGLQVEEDKRFQRRFWRLQRLGWILFALIVGVALLGLTGASGLWATRLAISPEGELDYPRVARWDSTSQLAATFTEERPRQRLLLTGELFDYFAIQSVQPTPARSHLTKDGHLLEFAAVGPPPYPVFLTLRPLRPGVARTRAELNGAPIEFKTWILP